MRLTLRPLALSLALVALTALALAAPARADEIKVFSSVAMHAVVEDLAARFQRDTGHRVIATFGVAATLKGRIESGESFDLAILTPAQLDDLMRGTDRARAKRVADAMLKMVKLDLAALERAAAA